MTPGRQTASIWNAQEPTPVHAPVGVSSKIPESETGHTIWGPPSPLPPVPVCGEPVSSAFPPHPKNKTIEPAITADSALMCTIVACYEGRRSRHICEWQVEGALDAAFSKATDSSACSSRRQWRLRFSSVAHSDTQIPAARHGLAESGMRQAHRQRCPRGKLQQVHLAVAVEHGRCRVRQSEDLSPRPPSPVQRTTFTAASTTATGKPTPRSTAGVARWCPNLLRRPLAPIAATSAERGLQVAPRST